MPKLATPLTDEQIVGLAPRDRPYKISDGHGLYLLVEPTGKKRWRLGFRLRGRKKTLAFGIYPDLSLADARQQCIDANRLIRDGIDPVEWKRQQRRQAQAATPTMRKFHLSMNDQGGMVIENRSHRMALSAQQVAALRAFLIATGDEIQGE
jgi:hypothetical protein